MVLLSSRWVVGFSYICARLFSCYLTREFSSLAWLGASPLYLSKVAEKLTGIHDWYWCTGMISKFEIRKCKGRYRKSSDEQYLLPIDIFLSRMLFALSFHCFILELLNNALYTTVSLFPPHISFIAYNELDTTNKKVSLKFRWQRKVDQSQGSAEVPSPDYSSSVTAECCQRNGLLFIEAQKHGQRKAWLMMKPGLFVIYSQGAIQTLRTEKRLELCVIKKFGLLPRYTTFHKVKSRHHNSEEFICPRSTNSASTIYRNSPRNSGIESTISDLPCSG